MAENDGQGHGSVRLRVAIDDGYEPATLGWSHEPRQREKKLFQFAKAKKKKNSFFMDLASLFFSFSLAQVWLLFQVMNYPFQLGSKDGKEESQTLFQSVPSHWHTLTLNFHEIL